MRSLTYTSSRYIINIDQQVTAWMEENEIGLFAYNR